VDLHGETDAMDFGVNEVKLLGLLNTEKVTSLQVKRTG